MGKKYYYFTASLPLLTFDFNKSMALSDFLNSCDELLDEKDSKLLRNLIKSEETRASGNKTCELWLDFSHAFKNQIAYCRAKKLGKDPYDYIRGEKSSNTDLERITEDALKTDNLLDATKIIDRQKWQYLDELEKDYYFDFANVIIYGLKLQILEKYKRFQSEEKDKILDEYKNIEKIKGVASE